MLEPTLLNTATLHALAPLELASYREQRYQGITVSVPFATFDTNDQQLLREVYAHLLMIYQLAHTHLASPEQGIAPLNGIAAQISWRDLIHRMQQLGAYPVNVVDLDTFSKVVHDLRGGAFQTLSAYMQFLAIDKAEPSYISRLFFLSRDHCKIMRNAIPDLLSTDDHHDWEAVLHPIDLVTEKWHQALHTVREHKATVYVMSLFHGNIAERCLEFSALDRVLYNLINNATRFAADKRVYLSILPVPNEKPRDLRMVVINRVTPQQQRALEEHFGQQLGDLFMGGFTTGGSGMGMQICADFVANAYGVRSLQQSLAQGYLGARILDEYFVVWFHWPIAGN